MDVLDSSVLSNSPLKCRGQIQVSISICSAAFIKNRLYKLKFRKYLTHVVTLNINYTRK